MFDFEDDAADNPTFYADLSNPQSFNKSQYTYNNPYKYNDPTGHCPLGICVWGPQVGRLADRLAKTAAGGAIIAGAAAAADTVVETVSTALRSSANAGIGDASCPSCNSSQRMGQHYMSQNRQAQKPSSAPSVGKTNGQAGGNVGAKGPNPNGKKGGPKHQKEVKKVEREVRSRGLKSQREYMIRTPGGEKSKRFVDVVGIKGKKVAENASSWASK